MMPRVDGIVLAAGRSRRIGRSKPLLRIPGGSEAAPAATAHGDPKTISAPDGARARDAAPPLRPAGGARAKGADDGETFLERAVRRLDTAGCRSVIVVIAAGDDPVHRLARALGANVVENPEPDSQPIDSIRLAIASLPPDSAAIVVLPVDIPLVTAGTVATLIEAFGARHAPIVAPSHRGELGHPVLIAQPLFRSVMTEPLEHGLRSLIENRRGDIDAVRVDDAGTLVDIDTTEDYDRFIIAGDFENQGE